jgi:hypothetical protein
MCVFKYHAFIFLIRPPRWQRETILNLRNRIIVPRAPRNLNANGPLTYSEDPQHCLCVYITCSSACWFSPFKYCTVIVSAVSETSTVQCCSSNKFLLAEPDNNLCENPRLLDSIFATLHTALGGVWPRGVAVSCAEPGHNLLRGTC